MDQVKFSLSKLDLIKSYKERTEAEHLSRFGKEEELLSFGVQYFDDSLLGIKKKDLVVVAAPPGFGKTELVTHIAMTNVRAGKRVCMFALEAEENEIEARIKYKILAEYYYRAYAGRTPPYRISYASWIVGRVPQEIRDLEESLKEIIANYLPTLKTRYRTRDEFTVETFEKEAIEEASKTDLIIVDHLGYFDSDDDNENRSVKKIMTRLKAITDSIGVPIVLVAHIRKGDRRFRSLCPDLEDIHGAGDIGKVATKAITIASAESVCPSDSSTRWSTFTRVTKFRDGGDRRYYIGVSTFDNAINSYSKSYLFGKLSYDGSEFNPITDPSKIPDWARENAKVETIPYPGPMPAPQTGSKKKIDRYAD